MMIPTKYFGIDIILDPRTVNYGGSFTKDLEPNSKDVIELAINELVKIHSPTLIDVGACTGSYALLPLLIKTLSVHSFEPSKAFEVLDLNIKTNGVPNVILNKLAVSNFNGESTFNEVISDNDSCIALSMLGGLPAWHKKTKQFIVDVINLDDYCKNIKVDFIKIDVEGNELNVVLGAIKTITRDKPIVMFEYSLENTNQYGYNPSKIIDLLDGIGYTSNIINNDVISKPKKNSGNLQPKSTSKIYKRL